MPEPSFWTIYGAIAVLGLASQALRLGGYFAVGNLPPDHVIARFLRLAPGNMLVAFAAVGCLQGSWPALAGTLAAIVTMALTGKDWAATALGFGAAVAVAAALA